MRCADDAHKDEVSASDVPFELMEACRNAFCKELAREAAADGRRRSMTVVAVSVSTISAGNAKIRRRMRRLDDEVSCLILFLDGVASTLAAVSCPYLACSYR